MSHRVPLIIAHRGAPREQRENTLPAFARALERGATGIELDVHATRDGEVVVHHDPVVKPRTGAATPLAIAQATRASLDALLPPDERIPTLNEVMDLVAGRVTVFVEIKARAIEDAVVRLLRASPGASAVHSFDHRIVRRVHALAPEIPCGILLTSYLIDPVRALRDAGATDLWQQDEMIDAALVEVVHAAGGRVIAWTVNDAARARELASWRVDGICSDVSGAILEALH